jgi:hypothetical protein
MGGVVVADDHDGDLGEGPLGVLYGIHYGGS